MRTLDPRASRRLAVLTLILVQPLVAAASAADTASDATAGESFAVMKDGRKVPLFTEQFDGTPVAKVGPGAVTLGDLTGALAGMHQGAGAGKGSAKDFNEVLDRLVAVRLTVLEAESMGITELPEFKAALTTAEDRYLREALRGKVGASAKADPREVRRLYRDATREWNLRSILFTMEEDAKRFEKELAGGAKFEGAAKRALAEGKAKGGLEPVWLRESKLSPAVAGIVRKLPVGGVTPALQYGPGLAVLQVAGKRQVNDPAARAAAEAGALAEAQVALQRAFYNQLLAKYAKVDRALLSRLDLEAAKPGLDALEKDQRPLARIAGEPPITVGDLVSELGRKYFHGAEGMAKKGRLNAQKATVFEDMLEKRLFTKEARAQKLQDTYFVGRQIREFRDQVLLTSAVERAVLPSVKVTDGDLRAYYDAHRDEFTSPAMLRLDALAFERTADAQRALEKLRAGTDFKWMIQNADGRADPSKQAFVLDGSVVSASELPAELGRALSGAKTGDYRLCADPGGAHLVVRVLEAFPPQRQPLEAVKGRIEAKVRGQRINAAFEEWTGKLRQQYPVEILIAKLGV